MTMFKLALCALAITANGQVVEMSRRGNMVHSNFQSWPDVHKAWNEFKELYKKAFATAKDDLNRMHIWLDNLAHIEAHNAKYRAGEISFKLEMTQYGDLSHEEFQVRNGYLGISAKRRKSLDDRNTCSPARKCLATPCQRRLTGESTATSLPSKTKDSAVLVGHFPLLELSKDRW